MKHTDIEQNKTNKGIFVIENEERKITPIDDRDNSKVKVLDCD